MISIIQSRIKSVKNTNIHTCEVTNQCSNVRSETIILNRQATREPIRGNSEGASTITKRTAILRQLLKIALRAKEIDIYTRYEPNALPVIPNIYKWPPRVDKDGTWMDYELRYLRFTRYVSVLK